MVLFPGPDSIDLNALAQASGREIETRFFSDHRILTVMVIDGTWQKAKQMMRLSPNLQKLEKVSFTPRILSQYRFRKQPHPQYVSTIEAVYELLSLLDPQNPADELLQLFSSMVEKQIVFSKRK